MVRPVRTWDSPRLLPTVAAGVALGSEAKLGFIPTRITAC